MKTILGAMTIAGALTIGGVAHAQNITGPSNITASSSIPTNTDYPSNGIAKIVDGNVADGVVSGVWNGFIGKNNTVGTITLTFNQDYDLTQFYLWNDVNIQKEGVRQYKLTFYNAAGTVVGSTGTLTTVQGQAAPFVTGLSVSNVRKVVMQVISHWTTGTNYPRVEIREVAFSGKPSVPPPVVVSGDHYQCYKIDPYPGSASVGITAGDQFGSAGLKLGPAVLICNPATKVHNDRRYGVKDPKLHFVCYRILSTSVRDRKRKLRIQNQFEDRTVVADMRDLFCVPSLKTEL